MKYLPILGELLSCDSIVFMLIGLVIATIVGIEMKNEKNNLIGLGLCFAIYVVCEVVSQIGVNYLRQLIALFIGTIAIGAFAGFLMGLVVSRVRK